MSWSRAMLAPLALLACAHSEAPVLVGVAGPFTEPRGVSMRRSAQLAAQQINAAGGIAGRPIRLVFTDDSGSEDVAIRVARTFYDNPQVIAVVGHLSSNASLVAGRIYGGGTNPLVMITPSASSPDLSGLNRYVFRVTPNDVNQGQQIARYARETLGARRAGLIYINNEYGRGLRRAFDTTFLRLGGLVVEEDPYLPATSSLAPYLLRLQRRNVDVLMLAAERPGAELTVREMRQLGMHIPVIGGDALSGIEALGAPAEGLRYSAVYMPEQRGERNAAFVAAYGRAYSGQRPDHRGAGAYDIVDLLAQAMRAVGVDRQAVRDYVSEIGSRRPTFVGVAGPIAFDTMGDVPSKPVAIGIVRAGRFVEDAQGIRP